MLLLGKQQNGCPKFHGMQEPCRAVFQFPLLRGAAVGKPILPLCIVDLLFLKFMRKIKEKINITFQSAFPKSWLFWSSPYVSGESQQQLMDKRSIKTKTAAAYSPNPTMYVKRRASVEEPYIFMNSMFPVTRILSNAWLKETSSLQGRQKAKAGLNNGKTDLQVCQ